MLGDAIYSFEKLQRETEMIKFNLEYIEFEMPVKEGILVEISGGSLNTVHLEYSRQN